MEKLKIALVAKKLGVSLNSVYRKVKLCETELNGHVTKENGLTYVSPEGVEILTGLFQKLNPSESPINTEKETISHLREMITGFQKTLDTVLKERSEERARADAIIMRLTHQNNDLHKALEYRTTVLSEPPRPVTPWQPAPVINPLQGKPWYQRLWVKYFEPEKLRRFDF